MRRQISAIWACSELQGRGNRWIKIDSVYDKAINLRVEGWTHLLSLASPQLYRGPFSVGLSLPDYAWVQKFLRGFEGGQLSQTNVILQAGTASLMINWGKSQLINLNVPIASKGQIPASAHLLKEFAKLLACEPFSPSTVLLGLGNADIMESPIGKIFPGLLEDLLDENWGGFFAKAQQVVGIGHGLTPTSDDLLHGALIALKGAKGCFLPPFPPEILMRTTALGGHMLETGRLGLTPEPIKNLLNELIVGSISSETWARVLEIGYTSGKDVSVGIYCLLKMLADRGNRNNQLL